MSGVNQSHVQVDASCFQREEWDRVAPLYDSTWGGLSRQFAAPLVEAAETELGHRVLDIACGPGYVAAAAAARGADVTGIDLSPAMVREARRCFPRIKFREGSAERLDLPEESFDRVLMNFGIMHLAHPEVVFREMRRVLHPRGRFGFTIWAAPEGSPGKRIVKPAVQAHAVPIPDLPTEPPIRDWDYKLCRQTLAEAGFEVETVRFVTIRAAWVLPSPDFLFAAQLRAGMRTAALLAHQPPDRLDAIRRDIEAAVVAFASDEGYALPVAANVVLADVGSQLRLAGSNLKEDPHGIDVPSTLRPLVHPG